MKKHKQTILPLLLLTVLLLAGLCDRTYAEESAQYPYLTSFEMVDVDFFGSPTFNTGKDGTPIGVEWKNYPDGPQESVNKTECDYVLGEIKVYTNGVPTGNMRKRKAYVTPVYTLANSDLITQYATASGKQAINTITAGNSTTATTRSDIICFTTADGTKYSYNLTVLDGSDQPIETPTEITLESIAVNRTAEDTATIYIKSNVAGTYYYAVTEADEGPSFDETAETTALRRYANTIQLTGLTAGAKKLHILAKSEGLDNVTVSFDVPKFAVAHSLSASTSLIWEDQGDKDGNRKGNVVFTNQSGTPITSAFEGETVTATAEPYSESPMYEFSFVQWKDETGIKLTEEQCKTNTVTFKMPDADVTLFAEFKNVGTTVTWGSTPNGAPAVTVNGNTRDTQYVYRTGSTAIVNFNSDGNWKESWVLLGWEIMIDDVDRANDPEYVTYNDVSGYPSVKLAGDNVQITAKFRSKTFATVTAKADPAMGSAAVAIGNGEASPSQSIVFEGQTVTLTATPGDRYTLTGWEVKEAGSDTLIPTTPVEGNANQATFTMPATDNSITATAIFAVDPDKASTACVLQDVELAIPSASVENKGTSYTITVPANTDADTLAAAVLKFTVSKYADVVTADGSVWPEDGKACGMTLDTPVTFTVRSEKCRIGKDDTAKADYTITVIRAKSTQCAIDSAKLDNVDGVVDQTGKTVTFTVPADTEDSAVATMPLTFTCSQYASIKLKDAEADWINDTACGMKLNEEKTFVVTAEDGTTMAKYTVVIHRTPSDKKALTGATLGDIPAEIDDDSHAVTFTVPSDTTNSTLGEMILKLTVSDYATVAKKDDPGKNWTEGAVCGMELDKAATFTVTAENGSTQDYTVTITRTKSTTKDITAVKLLDADKSVIAEGKLSGTTWTITLPSDTDKALINKIGTSTDVFMQINYTGVSLAQAEGYDDATGIIGKWSSGNVMCGISPNSSKTFTVTAEDGSTKTYTVEIKYTAPNAPTLSNGSATRTSKTGATVKFTSSEAGTYYYKVVTHGAAAPTVDEIKKSTTKGTASAGETTFTLSNLTEDARDIYIVVVSASGGESTALKIEIPAYGGGTETPDTGKFTITANAPKGGTITTNRTKADKGDEIIVTVTPDSGYQMVEGSLSYSLAVAGGETVKITGNRFIMPGGNVTITCKWETATTTAKGITSFSINGVAGAVNNTTNTITITMPRGTDVTKLTPTISTNGVKSLTPGSGETVNFTNSVTYTATMEDGSTKTYTVTVYVDKGTLADQFWDKLTDFVNQVPWWEYAKHQQSTSSYPKYW